MERIAPEIVRQRLLIEGFYGIEVNEKTISDYFTKITNNLGLKVYAAPTIFSPGGKGREENQGYDAFVPLIDSGISLYVWCNAKFFSIIIYTCKRFDEEKAILTTKKFFKTTETTYQSF